VNVVPIKTEKHTRHVVVGGPIPLPAEKKASRGGE
jgi:hypothetical protein